MATASPVQNPPRSGGSGSGPTPTGAGNLAFGNAGVTAFTDSASLNWDDTNKLLSESAALSGATVQETIANTSNTGSSGARLKLAVGGTSGGNPGITWNIPSGQDWTLDTQNPDTTPYADPLVLKRAGTQTAKFTTDLVYFGGTDNTAGDQTGANVIGCSATSGVGACFHSGTTAASGEVTALMLKNRYNSSFSGLVALEFQANQGIGALSAAGAGFAKLVSGSASGNNGFIRILTKNGGTYTLALEVDQKQSVQIGSASVSTTSTDGFPYIPVTAGTPTGVPTSKSGFAPIQLDSTNSKIWAYIGGAWKSATLV